MFIYGGGFTILFIFLRFSLIFINMQISRFTYLTAGRKTILIILKHATLTILG